MAKRKVGTSKAAEKAAKEARFVEAYCANGGNATKAYTEAGYQAKNANVAAANAAALIRNHKVAEEIKRRRAESLTKACEKTGIKAEEVVLSAARALMFDLRKLYPELDEEAATALELSGGKLKLDRGAAREQLMKHFGLYEKDNAQQPVPQSVSITVVGVRARR